MLANLVILYAAPVLFKQDKAYHNILCFICSRAVTDPWLAAKAGTDDYDSGVDSEHKKQTRHKPLVNMAVCFLILF